MKHLVYLVDYVVRSPNGCEDLGSVKKLRQEGRYVPYAHLLAVVKRVNDYDILPWRVSLKALAHILEVSLR